MKNYFFLVAFFCSLLSAQAQSGKTDPKLKVGDKAPAIRVYKWLKGQPVTAFRKGQIYIVEMGATW